MSVIEIFQHYNRTDISGTLKDSGRAISGPRTRMQSALVMGEMAMALVLLVGAGLMCRTLVQLWKVDPGFDPRNVSFFLVTPPSTLVDRRRRRSRQGRRFISHFRWQRIPIQQLIQRPPDDSCHEIVKSRFINNHGADGC